MSYYKDTKIVNRHLKRVIDTIEKGQTIKTSLLVFDIILNYEVGEGYVKKILRIMEENGIISIDKDFKTFTKK